MRVTFLPILVAALSVLSPIAAQDPTGDGTGVTDPNAGGDNADNGDTGATDDSGATDVPTATDNSGDTATAGPTAAPTGGSSGSTGSPAIEPTDPYGDSVFNAGSQVTAMWDILSGGDQWNNMTVELMTGADDNHIALTTVGSGIDATTDTSYNFTAPEVDPYSKIYFLRFSNVPTLGDPVWTTRFTIASKDSQSVDPPNSTVNAEGNTIQWGIGKLLSTPTNTAAPAPLTTTAAPKAGAGKNGITLYQNGMNTGTEIPPGITLIGVNQATVGAKGPDGNSASRAAAPIAAIGAIIAAAALFA